MIIGIRSEEICSLKTLERRRHVGCAVEGLLGSMINCEKEARKEREKSLGLRERLSSTIYSIQVALEPLQIEALHGLFADFVDV